jgi:hypothetical protein
MKKEANFKTRVPISLAIDFSTETLQTRRRMG